MSNDARNTSLLMELSANLADAVEQTEPTLVRVDARRRMGASGLVWRADGMIVTAAHVLEREDDVRVGLADGDEVAASIVGRDQGTDLALLKIDREGLTPVASDEQDVRVGHLVLALGRPHRASAMASLGVVSAIAGPRRTWGGGQIERLIRSDVTLYPGFSGGPLISASGQVLGLNTSILARGLAATLPWSHVSKVAEALAQHGSLRRGYLGIVTQPVDLPEPLRQSAGIEQTTALLVIGVEPGSPADQAGVLLGDSIVELGGTTIDGLNALQRALGTGSAGAEQTLRVLRGGAPTELNVTIGER